MEYTAPIYFFDGINFNRGLYVQTVEGSLTETVANTLYLRKTVADTCPTLTTFSAGIQCSPVTSTGSLSLDAPDIAMGVLTSLGKSDNTTTTTMNGVTSLNRLMIYKRQGVAVTMRASQSTTIPFGLVIGTNTYVPNITNSGGTYTISGSIGQLISVATGGITNNQTVASGGFGVRVVLNGRIMMMQHVSSDSAIINNRWGFSLFGTFALTTTSNILEVQYYQTTVNATVPAYVYNTNTLINPDGYLNIVKC